MKILGWPADSAGCGYYRVELPLNALAARGHDVHIDSVMPDEWRDTADVIVGQRVCLPGPTARWQNLARQGRAKLVLEIDDDLFNIHPSSKQARTFFDQPGIMKNLELNLRAADVVTVTTDYLAERMSAYNDNVVVLPNCIPAAILDHVPAQRDDVLTIGWGGSATHQIDWTGPDEHVARFITRNPGAELHVMGWVPTTLWNRTPAGRRRTTGWIASVDDLHRAIDYHIGVIPLRDNEFNRSKSAIKLLELAALGIPAVVADAGPYAAEMAAGAPALAVRDPKDWARHLAALVTDSGERRTLGDAAQAWARDRTIERNAHRWEAAYSEEIARAA